MARCKEQQLCRHRTLLGLVVVLLLSLVPPTCSRSHHGAHRRVSRSGRYTDSGWGSNPDGYRWRSRRRLAGPGGADSERGFQGHENSLPQGYPSQRGRLGRVELESLMNQGGDLGLFPELDNRIPTMAQPSEKPRWGLLSPLDRTPGAKNRRDRLGRQRALLEAEGDREAMYAVIKQALKSRATHQAAEAQVLPTLAASAKALKHSEEKNFPAPTPTHKNKPAFQVEDNADPDKMDASDKADSKQESAKISSPPGSFGKGFASLDSFSRLSGPSPHSGFGSFGAPSEFSGFGEPVNTGARSHSPRNKEPAVQDPRGPISHSARGFDSHAVGGFGSQAMGGFASEPVGGFGSQPLGGGFGGQPVGFGGQSSGGFGGQAVPTSGGFGGQSAGGFGGMMNDDRDVGLFGWKAGDAGISEAQSRAGGIEPIPTSLSAGFGSLTSDDRDCDTILTKSCSSDAECLCYGFYYCGEGRCKDITSSSPNKGAVTFGEQWHDGPAETLGLSGRR